MEDNDSNEKSNSLIYAAKVVFYVQCVIYSVWFVIIYGILGHVCPAAFFGIFTVSVTGSIVFFKKIPSRFGNLIVFIVTVIIWGLTFLFLHPNEIYGWKVEDPIRNITIVPFIVFIISIPILIYLQKLFTKNEFQGNGNDEITIDNITDNKIFYGLMLFLFLINIIIGLGYISIPWVKEELWNDNTTDWFDTQFYPGDVYYLFLIIAIIAIFSGILLGIHIFYFNKEEQFNKNEDININKKFFIITRILGYTLFGLVGIGGFISRIFYQNLKKK